MRQGTQYTNLQNRIRKIIILILMHDKGRKSKGERIRVKREQKKASSPEIELRLDHQRNTLQDGITGSIIRLISALFQVIMELQMVRLCRSFGFYIKICHHMSSKRQLLLNTSIANLPFAKMIIYAIRLNLEVDGVISLN